MTSFRRQPFVVTIRLVVILLVLIIALITSSDAFSQPAVVGKWSPVFDTKNVMIHAHVLPNGKVLFWGRREAGQDLNPHECTPRIWDPTMGTGTAAIVETANKPGYNLFCSGHAFLADGRLFVAGGHQFDGKGEPHVTIYDPEHNMWTPLDTLPDMSGGRWYPTAVTLSDGGVLVSFGTNEQGKPNVTQQVWKDGGWWDLTTATFINAPYYPRMHLVSDGRLFMSGPLRLTQFLDAGGTGTWMPFSDRDNSLITKEYAPSVLYNETPDDLGKVLFIGGGNGPTDEVETLDLNAMPLKWAATDPMQFKRRQHNATLLPDGTIVVMGGTQGTGAKYPKETPGFNDLRIGSPIRSAEIWDPKKPAGKHWSKMAKADVDRCYHSTAILLPDATVLSAGGGEYSPPNDGITDNKPEDTHKNAQIFFPPYLFRADGSLAVRPDITSSPAGVKYGDTFAVGTANPGDVGKVNWVRLSSVTHSFNSNQRINVLKFTPDVASVKVIAPADPKLCPPGHYMLFVINKDGVPSVAKIIKVHP